MGFSDTTWGLIAFGLMIIVVLLYISPRRWVGISSKAGEIKDTIKDSVTKSGYDTPPANPPATPAQAPAPRKSVLDILESSKAKQKEGFRTLPNDFMNDTYETDPSKLDELEGFEKGAADVASEQVEDLIQGRAH